MSEKQLTVKVPKRSYSVNVTDIKELTWGELEDLEGLQEKFNSPDQLLRTSNPAASP